ncbi:MAG: cbb3-type cytochrome c oxidase subunit 3 [Bacteroidetes bacterium]|nr:cbb3-type cytochrome c oxidase subunit 3 [Bacteroidota bacterium]
MYKEILQSIDNVQIWPVISFVIFFLFFLILLWYTVTVDRGFIHEMSEKPLDDGSNSIQPSNSTSL